MKKNFLFGVLVALGLCLNMLPAHEAFAAGKEKKKKEKVVQNEEETYKYLGIFSDVFEKVRKNYVEEVPDKQLIEYAINGMLSSLDPHSGYLDERDFKDMQVQTKGEFGGLGIEMTMENGIVKVVSPIDDTPAFAAGLKSGDYITHLDDVAVLGLSLEECLVKMRGTPGTKLKLTIRRKGEKAFDVTITRAIIKLRTVKFETMDNVGYIRVSMFNETTEDGVKKALNEISKKLGDKLEGYVLDLRNNPGGLLDQSIKVSSLFLDQGEIVSIRQRDPSKIERYNAKGKDLTKGIPLVVLINEGSASASEIVAGALQDHKRAIVLGVRSFGKGSVQAVTPISNEDKIAIRLTIARYYTPSGRSIQAKGIEPDIVIEQGHFESYGVLRGFGEADLPKALENDDEEDETDAKIIAAEEKAKKDAEDKKKEEAKKAKDKAKGKESKDKDGKDKDKDDAEIDAKKKEDFQLERAKETVKALSIYRMMNGKK